ncbi:MAG TPA: MFS transporter [Chthoniobacterales bacterium]
MTALSANIPRFIAFRVLFNARFYYPVLGVLFLDLGLTVEQYALLNVIWAVAIVALEIPSGALADVIGRKRMVVMAAGLMVVEMLIFSFAPRGNPALLFWLLAFNRFLSGAAEASASGADEALAYDSLPDEDRASRWPRVLVSLARWQSGAFFFAMIVGAAAYDASFVNSLLHGCGLSFSVTAEETVRWPVYGTLASAVLCLGVALSLREPPAHTQPIGAPVRQALRNIWRGACFVATEKRIRLLILAALVADSFVRLFLTFESNFLRVIGLPAYTYGPLGSALALLGFVAAPIARRLVERGNAPMNLLAVGACIAVGLAGVALATPIYGIWVLVPIGLAMSAFQFFLSHYLNAWTASDLRATVLSFRGLALNLGYGAVGLAFAGLTAHIRGGHPGLEENAVFAQALPALLPAFLVSAAAVALAALLTRSPRARR